MDSPPDPFDTLCRQVFMADKDTPEQTADTPSNEETALSLISRAQVYELPASYTTLNTSPSSTDQDRRCYRIHLETIKNPALQQDLRDILVRAIDPCLLLELPFDRNLSGYSSKTRTEACEAPLDTPVVLDMGGLSTFEEQGSETLTPAPITPAISDNDKTMLLIPTSEWLRMSGRIRFWRAESHRVKAAQREVALDALLDERWKSATMTISAPPPSSGSLVAAAIPPNSLPSSPAAPVSSSPTSLLRSSTAPLPLLRSSLFKQTFQEHQLDSLIQFVALYGDEPSATSILRGLFDLIRRQLTETKVLSWTFDRANLTEQKPEVTVAFLDLLARLGLELASSYSNEGQLKGIEAGKGALSTSTVSSTATAALANTPVEASSSTTFPTSDSAVTVIAVSSAFNAAKEGYSTELTWTFGPKVDDRRLQYWVHNIQQTALPVLKMDGQSLLPSTANLSNSSALPSTAPTSSSKSLLNQNQRQSPIPVAIRKRFLQDRNTIPAGTIQVLTGIVEATLASVPGNVVIRDRSFVLSSSKYALSPTSGSFTALPPGMFVEKMREDVKYLARWATTCGGRLDWIWAWLFSSFRKSRYRQSFGGSERRAPRSNDENV
ncbi:hypothetical protein EDD21DRAFT_380245 [Dissophora ornata]|nr:hypothetical protein BGZ58_010138 [Dissophora ornata]KAI8599296.1 hypothetical protein EDD21DRAFT_380245 [Dissophora ornata]